MRDFLFFLLATFLLLPNVAEGKSSLVGSTVSQHKQNDHAEEEGLPQIRNDEELNTLKESGALVPIPGTVRVDYRLEDKWRWCLPQTSFFLGDIGLEFQEVFGKRLQINSAVRTTLRQIELQKTNNNAVPVTGRRRSSHLTGATVDIAKIGLTKDELEWVRLKLLSLEDEEKLEATEEHDQLVFHVMIFQSYTNEAKASELRAQQ
ncbi:MAG: hypothetical protein AB201_01675 [Parcubacteria bacterium C7867-006]|nr:MAG: hypothetical protein AB201_01675 [Parcubacteria bacterium C7867-006]